MMDVTILISIAVGLISLIFLLKILSTRFYGGKKDDVNADAGVNRGQGIRRAAGVRNARRRIPDNIQNDERLNDNAEEVDQEGEKPEIDGKMGAKKRAKLEAKAEKKLQREAMEKEREERKKRDQQLLEEADKLREKEKLDELKREEAEKKAREEKEKKEHEEYMKMKEAFSVDEEGFDENDTDEENLLKQFIEYIKCNKVVILEDLAGHFNIKAASAIDRINQLQADGTLTGVIDDRGKFIYISEDELKAVAKFVKQQGRVSVTDLVENSNRLINLNPNTVSVN